MTDILFLDHRHRFDAVSYLKLGNVFVANVIFTRAYTIRDTGMSANP
jgi:hypothetical protein